MELAKNVFHSVTFKLENAVGIAFRHHFIGCLILQGTVVYGEIGLIFSDIIFGIANDGEVSKTEEIHFKKSKLIEGGHCVLGDHRIIVYRKRKIFFGDGRPESIIGLIGNKHKTEKFLIATVESTSKDAVTKLFEKENYDFETAVFVKPVSQDLKSVDLHSYDLLVFFNPADVKSLYENHPEFKQENIKFISYGKSVVSAMNEAGLEIEISAPTAEIPSVAKALELYLSK